MGGDESFDTVLTLPNILRKYNPNLKGFSTKTSLTIGLGQNSSHNGLNVGKFLLIYLKEILFNFLKHNLVINQIICQVKQEYLKKDLMNIRFVMRVIVVIYRMIGKLLLFLLEYVDF